MMRLLPQLSIKLRLNIILALTFIAITLLLATWNLSVSKIDRLNSADKLTVQISEQLYKLRRYETEFMAYKNHYYIDNFGKEYKRLKSSITTLSKKLDGTGFSSDKIVKLKAHLSEYRKIFNSLVDVEKKIGLDESSGLLSKLAFTKNRLDVKISELKGEFFKEEFLRLQLDERKFLSSNDPRYADFFDEDYEFMHEKIVKTNLYNKTRKDIIFFLGDYKKSFDAVVETVGIRGISRDVGIRKELKDSFYRLSSYNSKFISSAQRSITREKSSTNKLIYSVLGVISFVLFSLMFLIFGRVKRSIAEILYISKNLSSEDKDLRKRVPIKSGDEMEEISMNINRFIDETQKSIAKSKKISISNHNMSNSLNELSVKVRDRVEEEDSLIKHTTSQIHNFRLTLEQISYSIKELNEAVTGTKASVESGVFELQRLQIEAEESSNYTGEFRKQFRELIQNSSSVKNLLSGLSSLSEDIALLSINSAVEASRAGQYGEGFSVIADKMNLLSKSIEDKLSSVDSTVLQMNSLQRELDDRVEENQKRVEIVDSRISTIFEELKRVNESVDDLLGAVEEFIEKNSKLVDDSNRIVDTIESVDKLSSENKSSAITIYTTSVRLNDLSSELQGELKRFKT
jgi:methyl-accepting chemotaxis protein